MSVSDIVTLVRRIFKTAPVRYDSGRGLLDEPEPINSMNDLDAEQLLNTVLIYFKAKQGYVTMTDLEPVLRIAGRERQWLHNQVSNRVVSYRLVYDETSSTYEIML